VETAYRVERSTSPGVWVTLGDLPPDSVTFTDDTAPSGSIVYRVTALNGEIQSEPVLIELTDYSGWSEGVDWGDTDSDPFADAAGDGFANALAYAFAYDPLQLAPDDALPRLAREESGVKLTYRLNALASDIQTP